jgi:hypothetical protein
MDFDMEKDNETESSVNNTASKMSATLNHSSSIPLPSNHISRTESEAQLAVDFAAAERRDERMFQRLINGIQARHHKQALTNKTGFRTPRIAQTSSESQDKVDGHVLAMETASSTSRYCPVVAIAKIVDTHYTRLHDSQDRILGNGLQSSDDEYDEEDSTLPLTEMQRQFQLSRVAHTSESTLSDNDWSISGFPSSQDPNLEFSGDSLPKDLTEAPSGGIEEDDDDEEIFILDL